LHSTWESSSFRTVSSNILLRHPKVIHFFFSFFPESGGAGPQIIFEHLGFLSFMPVVPFLLPPSVSSMNSTLPWFQLYLVPLLGLAFPSGWATADLLALPFTSLDGSLSFPPSRSPLFNRKEVGSSSFVRSCCACFPRSEAFRQCLFFLIMVARMFFSFPLSEVERSVLRESRHFTIFVLPARGPGHRSFSSCLFLDLRPLPRTPFTVQLPPQQV